MGSGERLKQAVAELKPLRQGELDGLCGLYAIINWIRLGLYPSIKLTPGEQRWLFEHGIAFLGATGKLPTVATSGMMPRLWRRLRTSMEKEASELTGVYISAQPALPKNQHPERYLPTILKHLDEGRPIITTLWGRYDHTTVLVAPSDRRIMLFDSWGYRWIEMRSLGLKGRMERRRHMMIPSGTLVLTLEH